MMQNRWYRVLISLMILFVIAGMMPYAGAQLSTDDSDGLLGVINGELQEDYVVHAAKACNIKNLWASKHEVGYVTFKWTKESSFTPSGWQVKYRTKKIGNGSWSGWTTKSFSASTYQYKCPVKANYVVEIHARAKGDTSWSQGIITTPAGGKYQAMKTVYVKNVSSNKRIDSVTLYVGQSVTLRPDYVYPVTDYKKRPRLYPTHALWDLDATGKTLLTITKPNGSTYSGGMIDGNATITAKKAGTTNLICRAPNGRTKVLKVTVKEPLSAAKPDTYVPAAISADADHTYTFNGSTTSTSGVSLRTALASSEPTHIILKGTIQFEERYPVGSNTQIDASGATIYSAASLNDGCLTNAVPSCNYDAVSNIVIKGGTWKKESGFHENTMFFFVHGNNIRVENAVIECGYSGHCIELIACKDVVVKGCKLTMGGSGSQASEDEPMQLDHASTKTAPTITNLNPNAANCHACKNI